MAKARLYQSDAAHGKVAGLTFSRTGEVHAVKSTTGTKKTSAVVTNGNQLALIAAAEAWAALDPAYRAEWGAIAAQSNVNVLAGGSGYDDTATVAWPFDYMYVAINNGGSGYTTTPTMTITDAAGTTTTLRLIAVSGVLTYVQDSPSSSGYSAGQVPISQPKLPVTATLNASAGSGGTVEAYYDAATFQWYAKITNGGSGYTSYSVTEAEHGQIVAWLACSGGVPVGAAYPTLTGYTWYTEPALSISPATTNPATLAAAFYGWPYALPVASPVVSGGAVTSVNLTYSGSAVPNLPTPVVLGTGSGAVLEGLQVWTYTMSESSAGIPSWPSGYTAFTTSYTNIAGLHAVNLVQPPTHVQDAVAAWLGSIEFDNTGSGITASLAIIDPTRQPYVEMTNHGSGYTSAPTATAPQPGASGLELTAVLDGSTVGYVNITDPGQGYSDGATVEFTGGGGSGAAAILHYTDDIIAIQFYAEKPSGQSAFTGKPTGYQFLGFWWLCNANGPPNLADAFVGIFGSLPNPSVKFNMRLNVLEANSGLKGVTTTYPCLAHGGVLYVSSINSPSDLTGPPTIDWAGNPDPGATLSWTIGSGTATACKVVLAGSGGVSGSYGFVGYGSEYGCTVTCNDAAG